MWRGCCKLICCLVAVLLLAGCGAPEEFDPETAKDYAVVWFDVNHWQVTNAEGQEVYWLNHVSDSLWNNDSMVGDMECYDETYLFDLNHFFTTRYSEWFKVQTKLPTHTVEVFNVEFYKDGQLENNISVGGSYAGTATIHADGTVELQGNFKDFSVDYTFEEERISVEGDGGRRVKLCLKGGDIIAEGMVGEYTVNKFRRGHEGALDEVISSETRQGDS